MNVSVAGSRALRLFDTAKATLAQAAKELIEIAFTDPDGILSAFLKGAPVTGPGADGHSAAQETPVELLMRERPDVFRAAAAVGDALHALSRAGQGDPSRRNTGRMMEIGRALYRYACEHDKTYPDRLDVLFEQGYLKPPLEAKSLLTGRPFVYVVAGEKLPIRSSEWFGWVILYDDQVQQPGYYYDCVFAGGVGGCVREDELKEQIRKRA
jgi:hypothetical protein